MIEDFEPEYADDNDGIKSNTAFGIAGASIIYYSLFGFSFKYIPLGMLGLGILCISIFCIYKLYVYRKRMELPRKTIFIEVFGVSSCILSSIIISMFTVKTTLINGRISEVSNKNFLYSLIVIILYIVLLFYHGKKTKLWYTGFKK